MLDLTKMANEWRDRFKRKRRILLVPRSVLEKRRYMPHQGKQEMLRRRMGGNAMRIRMERAGFVWNDKERQYLPVSA
jgi:hypothetical protein